MHKTDKPINQRGKNTNYSSVNKLTHQPNNYSNNNSCTRHVESSSIKWWKWNDAMTNFSSLGEERYLGN